jgi:hypothetical protein
MKRTEYKGYVIDTDNLERRYIHNTQSPYSEDSDRRLMDNGATVRDIKQYIDALIDGTGFDLGLIMQNNKYAPQREYQQRKGYTNIQVKVPGDYAAKFRAALAVTGKRQSKVLRVAMDAVIREADSDCT